LEILSTGRQLAKNLRSAARLREIAAVLARHGFANVLERTQLGQKILDRFTANKDIEHLSVAERVRMSCEELGPTFVKMGQLLSTRPDLIPKDWIEEFQKFHDRVKPLPFNEIKGALERQFGDLTKVFAELDEIPMASASIAQVHKAKLLDGSEVVIKIRRPGIVETIDADLNALYSIAQLFEKYVPESRVYNPMGIVDEFFKSMELETNFIIEANNMLRFKKNLAHDPAIKVPDVYLNLCGEEVLVMERLKGIPLSNKEALKLEGFDPKTFVRRGMKIFFHMVFHDRFFHGDLHSGNLFVLPDSRIGLVDFGVVGRLTFRVREAIANMFVALAYEDYERLAFEFIDLAPYSEKVDVDRFSRELRDLIAPYFGLSFKNVNSGKVLLDATGLAARHDLQVPTDLVMFFKSIVTIEGMGRMVLEDFDILSEMVEISSDIVKAKYDPNHMMKQLGQFASDSTHLITSIPRQAKQFLRKINSPNHRFKLDITQLNRVSKSLDLSSFRIFSGLVIASLIVSASLALNYQSNVHFLGLPLLSGICYLLAGILAAYTLTRRS
jgi:ubiquinone biosynthesis protein